MPGHGHSHSCAGGCDHDDVFEIATDFVLHTKITVAGFECLGEEDDGSGIKVFKNYDERTNKSDFVNSDCDPELLFNIPFDGNVKLKSMIVIGGEDDFHPISVKLFKNKPSMTFDDVTKDAEQEIVLAPDPNGEIQYPVKTAKFNNVYHLSMYFPQSTGGDQTKVRITFLYYFIIFI